MGDMQRANTHQGSINLELTYKLGVAVKELLTTLLLAVFSKRNESTFSDRHLWGYG